MMKDTSYSKIPSNYGLCAADCPRGDTCLRRIAYDRIPANVVFPPTLHLKAIEAMAGKCKYYRSNEKVRYAKGFLCTVGALALSVSGTFRYRLIGSWEILSEAERRNVAVTGRAAAGGCACQEVRRAVGRIL